MGKEYHSLKIEIADNEEMMKMLKDAKKAKKKLETTLKKLGEFKVEVGIKKNVTD